MRTHHTWYNVHWTIDLFFRTQGKFFSPYFNIFINFFEFIILHIFLCSIIFFALLHSKTVQSYILFHHHCAPTCIYMSALSLIYLWITYPQLVKKLKWVQPLMQKCVGHTLTAQLLIPLDFVLVTTMSRKEEAATHKKENGRECG